MDNNEEKKLPAIDFRQVVLNIEDKPYPEKTNGTPGNTQLKDVIRYALNFKYDENRNPVILSAEESGKRFAIIQKILHPKQPQTLTVDEVMICKNAIFACWDIILELKHDAVKLLPK